ncbi:uncharacterized protein BX664DRAFT_332893 [Halteromyces radiatus]|uniref:uncharacterized protein n=1 Tax=Halteromyces radiatus TaxID=101107 RepID=UPI00222079F8|nr:uncharacterized protein BX664DRAFT_332893 [Halteromyces radiatus]KAI8089388.1 hypothetical protein BX664DRAFT_332893 [Halteromyces radiatus]
MSSLSDFLSSYNLQQYYPAFLEIGATDQDLPHILQLNEQELSEILPVIQMLPFHSIKFKKAIREHRLLSSMSKNNLNSNNNNDDGDVDVIQSFKRTPPPSPHHSNQVDDDQHTNEKLTLSHAVIYGKNSTRPLTSYEKAINRASIQLVRQDTSLLIQKGKLFDMAKKKLLDEGYQYKRGKSRSKLKSDNDNTMPTSTTTTTTIITNNNTSIIGNTQSINTGQLKRKEHATRQSEQRLCKLQSLQTELANIKQTILHTDDLQKRTELETTKREIVKEIGRLKAQERKHQWYKRKSQLRYQQQQQQQQIDVQKSTQTILISPSLDDHHQLSPLNHHHHRILPLPSPPHTTQSPPQSAFMSCSPSPPLLPSPSSSSSPPSSSEFYFRPLVSPSHQQSDPPSSPQSDTRAKVLTVRDCCTFDSS